MARKVKRPVKKKANVKKPAKKKVSAKKSAKTKTSTVKAVKKTAAATKSGKGFVRRVVDAVAQMAAPLLPGSGDEKPKGD